MPAHLSLPLWSHSALIFMANAFNTDHDDDGEMAVIVMVI